jgi:hypothetical protein
MQKKMHMSIDKSGKQGGVAQVDEFGALRVFYRGADGTNALAFDKHLAGLEQGSGIHLKKARGVEHDGLAGRLLRRGSEGKECWEENGAKQMSRPVHGIEYAASRAGCRVLVSPGTGSKEESMPDRE